ncbi:hypothetical protein BJ170DRAFT_717683 [Xylariales sp. AK1849]|nr:hypothetical protein BJ170DRAFT_717683 [Xylariales sp. AK1849]
MSTPTSLRSYKKLPAEIRDMIWEYYQELQPVTHHCFLLHHTLTPGGNPSPKRSYLAVDHYHRALNSNHIAKHDSPQTMMIDPNAPKSVIVDKIRLPGSVNLAGPKVTFANRFRGSASRLYNVSAKRNPYYLYVNFCNDVFYFHNEYCYENSGPKFWIEDAKLDSEFQFLANPVNRSLEQHLDPTMLDADKPAPTMGQQFWVRGCQKVAIRHQGFQKIWPYPRPARDETGYEEWLDGVEYTISHFISLQRLYIVLDIQDPACTLLRGYKTTGGTSSDGFVSLVWFLQSHRRAKARGHSCACRLPPLLGGRKDFEFPESDDYNDEDDPFLEEPDESDMSTDEWLEHDKTLYQHFQNTAAGITSAVGYDFEVRYVVDLP